MTVPATVRATDLYELATCPHRLWLDHARPRDDRAEPDPATRCLVRRGEELEAETAAALGYPRPVFTPPDWEQGAAQTAALLRTGAPGLFQAVLLEHRHLAVADLLERDDSAPSALGPFHYVPGDIKAGLAPRSDQVLQVAYAGWLLGAVQGRRPEHGFLVLGDGRRERFPLAPLEHVLQAARTRVAAILDGAEETAPFYTADCARCRWSGVCLPALLGGADLSLVDGMTPTRRRVLVRAGVRTVDELAALDPAAWRARGLPSLGIDGLVRQARALVLGRIDVAGAVDLPPIDEPALLVALERDPLDGGAPVLAAWRAPGVRAATVRLLATPGDGSAVVRELLGHVAAGARLYHFGAETARGLEQLAEAAALPPADLVRLVDHAWDLSVSLRRGTAFLPVRRYVLEDVDAAVRRLPQPAPAARVPAFVLAENLRRGVTGPWTDELHALAAATLDAEERVLEFLRSLPRRERRAGRAAVRR